MIRIRDKNYNGFKDFKVLIVEDNRVNQTLLRRMLEKLGIDLRNICIADDGSIAVDMIRQEQNSFDVIFMDLNMQNMGGVEAAFHIRKINSQIPIYAMTGNGLENDRQRCQKVGMTGFILKPLNKKILVSALQSVLEKEKSER